jgi:hypothetical protein
MPEMRGRKIQTVSAKRILRGSSTALIAKCAISFAQNDNLWAGLEELLDRVERLVAVDGFGQGRVD